MKEFISRCNASEGREVGESERERDKSVICQSSCRRFPIPVAYTSVNFVESSIANPASDKGTNDRLNTRAYRLSRFNYHFSLWKVICTRYITNDDLSRARWIDPIPDRRERERVSPVSVLRHVCVSPLVCDRLTLTRVSKLGNCSLSPGHEFFLTLQVPVLLS